MQFKFKVDSIKKRRNCIKNAGKLEVILLNALKASNSFAFNFFLFVVEKSLIYFHLSFYFHFISYFHF